MSIPLILGLLFLIGFIADIVAGIELPSTVTVYVPAPSPVRS